MLPPDAVRKAAFKRKGPTIAIVIGGEAKHGPPKTDEEKDEPKKGYGIPKDDPCEECSCEHCGNTYDPADAKNADADEQDEEEAEEKV